MLALLGSSIGKYLIIIIAILVAGIKCFFFGDMQIFSLMVSGKASDPANP